METIVITGASDGIGAASARQLKAAGYNMVLVGRSRTKTQALARELDVPFHIADYTSLADVARLASELRQYERIDVLANNAGGVMGGREVTVDGFEKTFQVNHLAPFMLTHLLMDKLIASQAKVIQTASEAANAFGQNFDIDDLNNERNYKPDTAYGHGKLANILFTRELDRRYRSAGISAVAFHPGVVRSNFASDTTHFMKFVYHTPLKYLITISPEKSAHRLVKLVQGKPGEDWRQGEVYNKDQPMTVAFKDDGNIARKLWECSERFLDSWIPIRP
ncbi:SDR family NAD(P)-dependent oxidoreductase [Pseudomonas sp. B21-056]|uniref:SDR family NAD(P)-dependent oxidoreductase n=1 Tax=Pseudomonas sp. B21-056 TaxID=2895495 RepID=UPI002232B65F|nr:SDR family NAD(P)-dependent oxidoreductase [Pseudomonas sp. B21-056]UZE24783.1 SDR family NAD(P)-dependent oxidoreductase [Pseudomonas sp. B21-056]